MKFKVKTEIWVEREVEAPNDISAKVHLLGVLNRSGISENNINYIKVEPINRSNAY